MAAIRPPDLERAVMDLIADAAAGAEGKPWQMHAYRPDVSVTSVRVIDEGAVGTVEIRFKDAGHPGARFGARLRLGEHMFGNLDFEAEKPELVVAAHVLVALGELTFAGGDPLSWESDGDGTRWYVDEVL